MQISLRLQLDTTRDRFRAELEPGTVASTKEFPVEYCKEPGTIELDAKGFVLANTMPGLKQFFDSLAGDKPKGGK
jgi:hypothetical protein